MWAVFVFRHQDRIVGKAREVPYNLAQKDETKLRASQSQQRLWQLPMRHEPPPQTVQCSGGSCRIGCRPWRP